MSGSYDIYVDYNTLCTIEDKLQKIGYDLTESTQKMMESIQRSQDFLAGNQFEKAKAVTANCTALTAQTSTNIKHAQDYIGKLRTALEEYSKCGYPEEA